MREDRLPRGAVVAPGRWGATIRDRGPGHPAYGRELLLEGMRRAACPAAPLRWTSAFAFAFEERISRLRKEVAAGDLAQHELLLFDVPKDVGRTAPCQPETRGAGSNVVNPGGRRTAYNDLKELPKPKRPTVAHLGALLAHLDWLEEFSDVESLLSGLTAAKVRHFAAEARALDAAEMRDISTPKRSTLLLSLIARAQVTAHDDLARMFIRLMNRIHVKGRGQLDVERGEEIGGAVPLVVVGQVPARPGRSGRPG